MAAAFPPGGIVLRYPRMATRPHFELPCGRTLSYPPAAIAWANPALRSPTSRTLPCSVLLHGCPEGRLSPDAPPPRISSAEVHKQAGMLCPVDGGLTPRSRVPHPGKLPRQGAGPIRAGR